MSLRTRQPGRGATTWSGVEGSMLTVGSSVRAGPDWSVLTALSALSEGSATVRLMTSSLTFLAGLALGAAVAWWTARAPCATRLAAALAERDLLGQRVIDLESAVGQDRELAAVLAPIGDSLGRVEAQFHALERDRLEQFSRLDASVRGVAAAGESLRAQTASLAGALRSSNARGAWGEVQLRRFVEHAGMLARVDFDTQVSATTPDGAGVRPDLVVRLPGGKQIVVDAKAPLTAFLDAYGEGASDDHRAERLRGHARALRGHVDALATRDYTRAFAPTPDLVVCFVPGESMLSAALEADPSLHEHALSRGVVLAGPGTLLALLRTVAFTWQQDALAGNARELFEVGRDLYARLGTLGGHSAKLGRTLHRAVEDYNALVGALEHRVLVTARRMSELDLATGPLPQVLPLDVTPRPLTATELLDDLGRRPELLDEPAADPRGSPLDAGQAS
jgi:DNA recombination protein RmuC